MASKRQLLLIEINFWILGPPLGGFFRILKKGLVKLISLFTKVPTRLRKVFCMVGKNPSEFIATWTAEVLIPEIWIFFLASGNDPVKKMATDILVIGDAVELGALQPIVGIEINLRKMNFAATPHIDSQTQITMDDSLNFSTLVNFKQHILSVGFEQETKVPETARPMTDDREHDVFQYKL